jgi:hypothetical protein
MTKLVTAGAVLVLAIVFGFVFWNQLSSNQHQLAGGEVNTTSGVAQQQKTTTPKKDSLDMIDADLNSSSPDSVDSDSTQIDSKLKAY